MGHRVGLDDVFGLRVVDVRADQHPVDDAGDVCHVVDVRNIRRRIPRLARQLDDMRVLLEFKKAEGGKPRGRAEFAPDIGLHAIERPVGKCG